MNELSIGERMIRQIQATPTRPAPQPRPFATVTTKRDCECWQCGRIYRDTKREFCASCGTATVQEIQK